MATSNRMVFVIDDDPVVDYVLRPDDPQFESPRPYFAPMRTLAGDVVTEVGPADHVWHKGLSWSLPVVADENFWGGPSYLPGRGYVQLPNNGTQRHVDSDPVDLDGTAGTSRGMGIDHRLHWLTEDGRMLFTEARRITVTGVDDRAWVLTFSTVMINVGPHPIALGSPNTRGHAGVGYGGLFWRGPSSFTGGRILIPVDAPPASTAEEPREIRASWLGFAGEHPNGHSSTIVMVNAEENESNPTSWFARSVEYPGVCAAPFFDSERVVPPAGEYRARYAVVVSSGDHDAVSAEPLAAAGRAALRAVGELRAPAHPLSNRKDLE